VRELIGLIFLIVICSVFSFSFEFAFGCTCDSESLDVYFARSDYVFLGTVEKIELTNTTYNDVFIKIDRFWKGIETENVVVQTLFSTDACGYSFSQNQTYLVFARESTSGPVTSSCSGTNTIENLEPGWRFLMDNDLLFLQNTWIEQIFFRFWALWVPIITVVGFLIYFKKRKRTKDPKFIKNQKDYE